MECAFCPKDDHDTWLGAYTVGEHHVCTTCYHRYIAEGEPPSKPSEQVRVEVAYTVEGLTKAEAADQAHALMEAIEGDRVAGFSVGTTLETRDLPLTPEGNE